MADWDLSDLAQELSDLEVALLLCLIAHEHPLLETTDECIGDVAKELALICSNTFGFSCTVVDCSAATSVEDFCHEILAADARKVQAPLPPRPRATESSSSTSFLQSSQVSGDCPLASTTYPNVANVVVAKNFNYVNGYIQLQALELMRTRKITAKTDLSAPADFLFVPLIAHSSDRLHPSLNMHLNDHLFISHYHNPEDGYTYLEGGNDWLSDSQLSASSVVRKPASRTEKHTKISQPLLEKFRQESNAVTINADVIRYQQDIVVFLRLSRAVAGGITTKASYHFSRFSKVLAALHGIDYLTPSITALAAKKVFRHRIVIARPEDDRSLQYGSDLETVSRVLAHVSPEEILNSVLTLEAPL